MSTVLAARARRRALAVVLAVGMAVGCVACGSDARGDRTLKFTIEPPPGAIVVHEPLPIRLTLTNDGAGTPVPTDYLDADVLTLTLYDAGGTEVATANGYTTEARLGNRPAMKRQESMRTADLPGGRAMQWTVDLLEYFDLDEPGDYGVEARFAFRPSGIDVRSERASITVAPNDCRWLAFHADQVALALVMYLERHEGDGGPRTLVHFARPDEPTHFWKGYVVPVPPAVRARLSQADFMTLDTFEHDFQRWVAWVGNGTAGGLRLDEQGKEAATFTAAVEAGDSMIGNPVQHQDHGVSVLVLGGHEGEQLLRARRFDAAGGFRGERTISTYRSTPSPLTASSDWNGNLYALSATGGRLPLDLVVAPAGGAVLRYPMLSPGTLTPAWTRLADADVLALRADTQLVVAKARAVLALLRVGEAEEQRLVFVRIALADDGSPANAPSFVDAPFPRGLLGVGEQVAAAVIAQGAGRLHAAVTTSRGRVLYLTPDQTPREIATVPAATIGQADLLLAGGGVYLVHPTEMRGMRHTVIEEPPARP